ncbi:hypothetical protein OESDEN_05891 [Oesophagostomum dentatum]|uniref:Uncharacterized protein n=1 Tax=Oesophagostomum dentatum TaxID=61180 RepID=A0A0B1TAD0_OESDE|nr:hypothetical protein OESDEN_05891 [Oesophagostomum dentatum]
MVHLARLCIHHIENTNIAYDMPEHEDPKILDDFAVLWRVLDEIDVCTYIEILLAPMIVAGLLGRVDVKATSTGSGGITALPRAVRHGVALGIAALYPKTMEPLRLGNVVEWQYPARVSGHAHPERAAHVFVCDYQESWPRPTARVSARRDVQRKQK